MKRQRLNITLPSEVLASLDALAAEHKRRRSWEIEAALMDWFRKYGVDSDDQSGPDRHPD